MKCWALVLAGCAAGSTLPPAAPDAAWSELTSEHFVLWTHGSVEAGQHLVREMEHLRQVVIGVAFPTADARGKVTVIAFRDAEEVSTFVPKQFVAYSWAWSPLWEPMIVVASDASETDHRILTHELTHVISRRAIQVQPPWFAEGLAGYFETTKLDPDRARVEVGTPLPRRGEQIRRRELMPVADVFACVENACMNDGFYATTWALFTFLKNARPAELARYEQALAALPQEAKPPAWIDIVPELPADKLQHELSEWLQHGSIAVARYDVALKPWSAIPRPMMPVEAHALRALVRFQFDRTVANPDLDQTLAADPANLIANLIVSARERSASIAAARAVAAAHPDDWRAWWLVGYAVQRGPEAKDARDKLCAAGAKDPSAPVPPQFRCATLPPP